MNPPDHPTPRTDAAWAASFSPERATFSVRDECEKLERELVEARSERDLHRNRLASILWSGAIDKHTCGDVQKWTEDYTAENTRLRAELAIAENWVEHHSKHADDLIAENARLRAELERLKIIEEKFRQSPMWDVLAIVQTRNNWQACAEKAEAEVERWQTVAAEMSQEREHNANEASRLRAEVEQLNLELEANKRKGGGCQCSDDEACAHVRRAEKAETELAAMKGTL
jgi:hypothetical protein